MARRTFLTLAIVGLLAAATTPAFGAATHRVGVTEDKPNKKWGFAPTAITVSIGDTIEFVNDGAEEHDFTALDNTFASPIVKPGETFAFTFTAPGRIVYYCTFHDGQEGLVIVQAGPTADAASSGSDSGY